MAGPIPEKPAASQSAQPTQPYSTPFTASDGRPSPFTLEPGAMFGPYRIEHKLGQGGMGVVYRATDTTLDRVVAFKVMRPELLSKPNFKERFLREAKAAAQVMHPNVVVIHQAGELHGTLFMAFEFVPGGDLSTRIENGPMDPSDAVRLLIECASGLDAIHQAGMVHRDIKPQNIFLDKQGRSKLGDLGLARSAQGDDRMTVTGVAIGTPAFMSPEQIEGEPDLDIRSDIHALGATLFNVLTGKPPFNGNTVFSITHKIMAPERPSLRDSHSEIPERLQRIVHKAMARDRTLRYQTPQELIDDLRGRAPDAAFHGVPPPATTLSVVARAAGATTVETRFPEHHHVAAWARRWAFALLLGTLLVLLVLWIVVHHDRRPAVLRPAHVPPAAASEPKPAQSLISSPQAVAITPVIMEAPVANEHPSTVVPAHPQSVAQELFFLERHFSLTEEEARRLLRLLTEFRERRLQILRDSNDVLSPATLNQIRRQRERTEFAASAFLTLHQQELLHTWLTSPHPRVHAEVTAP